MKEIEPEKKMQALPYLQYIFKQQNMFLRGKIAGELLQQELGLSEDNAFALVSDYADSLRRNEFSGGIVQLPEPQDTAHPENMTELEKNIAWFTISYMHQSIGLKTDDPLEDSGLIEEGKYWFNNKEKDTVQLVEWMRANPDKIAKYAAWAYGTPGPNEIDFVREFQDKAQKGELREVKLK
jgi:hypothetical protein